MVVDMIKSYGRPGITGTQFMVYSPSTRGIIPTPDLVFTWKGIEQYNLDDIHTFFRDIATNGVTYALIGNSPGVPNAEMAEKGSNTFSIVRPQSPSLNVRAFPFGFNKATRVFHMPEKQLLFYNASEMRDSW